MAKRALITGITGQDGAYVSALLLKKGYTVFGLARHTDTEARWRLRELGIDEKVRIIAGGVEDGKVMHSVMEEVQPEEIYNLAAQSVSAKTSWEKPEETEQINVQGVQNILNALEQHVPHAHLFQASSSEMYGKTEKETVNEKTPFHPENPYAVSKLEAHKLVQSYRAKGFFVAQEFSSITNPLFGGPAYVTRKISKGIARISLKLTDTIELGNLDAKRDWGFAGDYAEAMWRMLQQETPDDFVIATGRTRSVRDILQTGFLHIGIADWSSYVVQNPEYMRKAELQPLRGDIAKAKSKLHWEPETTFEDMIRMMIDADIKRLQP